MNYTDQEYNGVTLRLIKRDYTGYKAKRYTINGTNQNIWIPNKHLQPDGTLNAGADLRWIFNKWHTQHKINLTK